MTPEHQFRPLGRALAGAAALAVAMGIGRFAYTALLPSLQRGLGFDDAAAGAHRLRSTWSATWPACSGPGARRRARPDAGCSGSGLAC